MKGEDWTLGVRGSLKTGFNASAFATYAPEGGIIGPIKSVSGGIDYTQDNFRINMPEPYVSAEVETPFKDKTVEVGVKPVEGQVFIRFVQPISF